MNSRPFLPAKSSRELADSLVSLQSDTFGALLAAAGGLLWLGVVLYIVRFDDFWPGWGTLDLMLTLVGICFALKGRSYHLAAGLFVAELLAGIYVFVPAAERQPLVLSLFAPVVLIAGTLLGSRAAFLTALAASLAVGSAEPLLGASISPSLAAAALGLIWLTALTSWAATRNLYTALGWAWENNEEAERNLAEAREYQAKLVAALRQLEEANYRLERANYALTWARAEADQARRLKAQFAAHVSHELRTPINLVVGFAELMRAGMISRLPRIFAVQPQNCGPIAAAFAAGAQDGVPVAIAPTIAEGTAIAQPVRMKEVLAALRGSGGGAVTISEERIAAAALALAGAGLYVEPTCAQVLAGFEDLLQAGTIAPEQTSVLVLTGAGAKATPRFAEILGIAL